MRTKPFTLKRISRSGRANRWRVRGTLFGERISRTFDDAGKAKAFREAKEMERVNGCRELSATLTRLTRSQAFDAEKALAMLDGKATLCQAVEGFLAAYVAPERALNLSECEELYDEERMKSRLRGLISKPTHRCSRGAVARFAKWVGREQPMSSVTTKTFQDYLDHTFTSPKNYENIRGYLSTFFKFALNRGHLKSDPTIGTTSLAKQNAKARGIAVTLRPSRVRDLFAWLEENAPEIIPAYALMTFAGIRPCKQYGEITKLSPDHVNLDLGIVTVSPGTSKVKELRKFKMTPNLEAWLRAYPLEKFPITCGSPKRFKELRVEVGARFDLSHDVLRHTAITYWVAKNKSLYEAADQFGNSEAIIRKHYKDNNRTEAEDEEFFEIFPRTSCGKMIDFAHEDLTNSSRLLLSD